MWIHWNGDGKRGRGLSRFESRQGRIVIRPCAAAHPGSAYHSIAAPDNGYPFTPLLLTLWTNHFWNNRNVISTGIVTIAA
jgi:hypothetical protein